MPTADRAVDDETKRRIALDFLDGLRSRDWARMRSVLADSATWSLPGATAVSGVARGADEVVARGRTIVEGGVGIELVRVIYGLDNVAVVLHNTAEREGAVLDEHLTTIFTLDGEHIASVETLISDVAMLNAFFGAD